MNLKEIKYIYFIGIGGIGMSALARWFSANGYQVAGYDLTPSSLTAALMEEGMPVHYEDKVDLIPSDILQTPTQTLVVYTPAVPAKHVELNYFQANGFEVLKRSQVLGLLTRDLFTIAIAGTHGKTTTSAMIAHLLTQAGKNVTAFLGGITQNYGSNLLVNQGSLDGTLVVAEADEYDRSFLTLHPDIAIITSTDADHLDIYGSHEQVLEAFYLFIQKIKPGGTLLMRTRLPLKPEGTFKVKTYSRQEEGMVHAQNVRMEEGRFVFDVVSQDLTIPDIQLGVPGYHNVENATAAAGVGLELGLSAGQIREGLASFRGVKRRFEFIHIGKYFVQLDDYAHHPAEIEAFLTSLKALYPQRKVTAIFQPHLYTRTRDFAPDFARSLSLADEVLLLDIYPARELPIPGVSSDLIFKSLTSKEKQWVNKKDLLSMLKTHPLQVVVTIGAGDIDRLIQPIKDLLIAREDEKTIDHQ
jgi:UDP-N-acetylmuramate--alanine ligase